MCCVQIGFAGSDEKVQYIKDLGFDAAYNYKTMGSMSDTLKEACPKGIDLFFDNVSLPLYLEHTTNVNDVFSIDTSLSTIHCICTGWW